MNTTARSLTVVITTTLVALLASGCEQAPPSSPGAAAPALRVFVSILPQAYFVKRVGGEHVGVEVLIGRGQSEHSYEPTPQQMTALGRARAFFRIGVSAEQRFVEQAVAVHKQLKIVDTRAGITLRKMNPGEACSDPSHHHDGHEHEADEHEHDAAGDDPHIWLDPQLIKVQARTICSTLREFDPGHASAFEENLRRFEADLDRVDERIAALLAPHRGKELFVFHPSYGYFADRYGLKQVAVEREGKDPGLRELDELRDRARAVGAKVIFFQPQFSRHPAEVMARAISGTAVSLDPLAEDCLTNLEEMAAKIAAALASQKPPSPAAESNAKAGSD